MMSDLLLNMHRNSKMPCTEMRWSHPILERIKR